MVPPPDKDTISAAMRAKIRDVNLNVRRCYRMKKRKERDLLRAVSDKSFILRRKLKKIRKKVNKERDKIRKKYIQKIDHLNVKQSLDIIEPKSTEQEVTVTPSRLADYTNLSVFGTVADLPSPSAPRGPFVGSDKIKLCEEEKAILSKDPKFSVRGKSDKIKFLTEVERMTSKHRMNEYKKTKPEVQSCRMDHGDQTIKKNEIKYLEKLDELYSLFVESGGKYVYNPFSDTINFNKRRASDYKLNKKICLPKPMSDELEL